jgi:hypothetical protein
MLHLLEIYANIINVMCRSGGMADALDSKSSEQPLVRVRVPPSAPKENPHRLLCGFLFFFF